MNPHELNILHLTTDLRTGMMDTLTDADLTYRLPNGPTLGELCRDIGNTERIYIKSFQTLTHDWTIKTTEPELATRVEKLKAWYKTLDAELDATVNAIPDTDFQSKTVDRGGGFMMPLGGQFHTYREAILIFCGKSTPYLLAIGKPLTQQWKEWIG
ncbi:MAG TPA: DinB family protein [Phototrophicaceae bacterium]|jgi:hypothetical protein|nr:DinB family protein [Phototrophicaceae bacterium]